MKPYRVVAALVALLTLVALAPVAAHHLDTPPVVVLKSDDTYQRAKLGTYCWSRPSKGGGSTGICADTFGYSWPRAKDVSAGERARVRFRTPHRPEKLYLRAWRAVDHDKQPIGPGESVDYRLRARRRDGRIVRYDAIFRLPALAGHYYLNVSAWWDQGDTHHTLHLRLR